jgi:hypothetical protein
MGKINEYTGKSVGFAESGQYKLFYRSDNYSLTFSGVVVTTLRISTITIMCLMNLK